MKHILCGLVALPLTAAFAAAGTAYDALNTIGKTRGAALVDRVMQVRGQDGAPEPKSWRISVKDDEARGGVRDFDVAGNRITGERAPLNATRGPLLNMDSLKLDSDGAYTLAETEAKKTGFAYDHVDYTLLPGTRSGAPVWELRLVDERNGNTATVAIAADTGKILTTDGLTRPIASNPARDPMDETEAYLPPPKKQRRTDSRPRSTGLSPSEGMQRAGDKLSAFFERVANHLERRGRQIGDKVYNVVTGEDRDTAGPHGTRYRDYSRKPSPPPTRDRYRDDNGTLYYRPRD